MIIYSQIDVAACSRAYGKTHTIIAAVPGYNKPRQIADHKATYPLEFEWHTRARRAAKVACHSASSRSLPTINIRRRRAPQGKRVLLYVAAIRPRIDAECRQANSNDIYDNGEPAKVTCHNRLSQIQRLPRCLSLGVVSEVQWILLVCYMQSIG